MKAKEFIYNLRTSLSSQGSYVSNATDQHIMYMLDEARATFAGQKLDAGISIIQLSQHLDVKPTKVPTKEFGTVGTTTVLKLDIPAPVDYKQGEAIFTVGATDGQDSYTRITYSQLRTVLARKYTASSPKWFWFNDAIYIINAEIDSLSTVRVRGIFQEPYKVIQAKGEYKYLDPFDWNYPLTLDDANTIYKIAFNADLGWSDTAAQAVNRAARSAEERRARLSTPQQTPTEDA